jgi:hypothetical protein
MNKFKFYFILLITSITIFSCSKNNNDETVEPLRDYAVQYKTDSLTIDSYLRANYITVTDAPGQTKDQDVAISPITNAAQPSIMSYLNSTTFPKLLTRKVKLNDVNYTLYYLVLREGKKDAVTGLGGVSPCNVDGVLTSYRGTYLSNTTATTTTPSTVTATQFEDAVLPNTYFELFTTQVIPLRGWSEIFPQFKTGSYSSNSNGTITYADFGAGVMFLPSGLSYYNNGNGSIPAYAPLVFSFKLYDIQRLDQDGDGIPSYLEDASPADGYMRFLPTGDTNPDDTDGDGIPDFYDIDDDGDNYTTKFETKYINPLDPNTTTRYYPFDGVLVDNPATPFVDERQGIPRKFTGPLFNPSLPESSTNLPTPQASDYTDPLRTRRHLDAKCTPPYQN